MLQYVTPTINVILRDRKTMLAIYIRLKLDHIQNTVFNCGIQSLSFEFGNWSLILMFECVQRRFTHLIDEIGTLPYSQRSDILNLTTLADKGIEVI